MNQYREAFKHIRSFPADFWVVIVATLVNQLGNMAFVYLMIYANQHLGYSLFQASLTFAAFASSMFFSGLLGGSLIDKMGAARVMIIVLIGNGISLLIFPFFQQFYSVTFLCLIWGFFYGLYRPASQTIISFLSTTGMHKITFSVYRLVINLGMSVGPVVGGYLAGYSFSLIFISNGIANLFSAGILFFCLGRKWLVKKTVTMTKIELNLKYLKHDPYLGLFILTLIPVAMIFLQHESTLPIFIKTNLNLPLSFFGWLMTINTLLIVFFELPLNIATINWSYRTNFILGSFFIAVGFAGMYFAALAWQIALLAVCWTIGEMILFPASNSYVADIAPEANRGSYMSLYNTSFNISLILGPWIGALIMQHLGAHGLWMACGLWGLLSIIGFYFLPIRKV